jgi:hypothetical protein
LHLTLFIIGPARFPCASELSGSKDTTMAALVFLYKLSHEIKVTYVQELIDALRYVGRTLLAARPLELAMGNVRAAATVSFGLLCHLCVASAHFRLGLEFFGQDYD